MHSNPESPSVSPTLIAACVVIVILLGSCSARTGSAPESQHDTAAEAADIRKNTSEIDIISPEGLLLRKHRYSDSGNPVLADGYPAYANYIKGYPKEDTISGDFNGDGKAEKAWFKDRGSAVFEDCEQHSSEGSCKGIVDFSDKSIRHLVIDYCPVGIFKNEGDINCDGKDEIGVMPGWFTSGCRYYYLFTYKKNRWIESCPPVSSSLNMREAGIVPIEKDSTRKGYAVIRESMSGYIDINPDHKIPPEYTNFSSCSSGSVVELHIKLR